MIQAQSSWKPSFPLWLRARKPCKTHLTQKALLFGNIRYSFKAVFTCKTEIEHDTRDPLSGNATYNVKATYIPAFWESTLKVKPHMVLTQMHHMVNFTQLLFVSYARTTPLFLVARTTWPFPLFILDFNMCLIARENHCRWRDGSPFNTAALFIPKFKSIYVCVSVIIFSFFFFFQSFPWFGLTKHQFHVARQHQVNFPWCAEIAI